MIGFSIEFKRWYFVLRGPKGHVYLTTGFAKRMPIITPTGTYTLDEYFDPEELVDEVLEELD